jgi:hypothetical protein
MTNHSNGRGRHACHHLLAHFLRVFLCQRLNTATSSPADDVHHYAVPEKLLDSILNKLPLFMRQWEKEKAVLYPVEVPPPYQLSCCHNGKETAC